MSEAKVIPLHNTQLALSRDKPRLQGPVTCVDCIHFLDGPSGMFCGAHMEWLLSVHQPDCPHLEAV